MPPFLSPSFGRRSSDVVGLDIQPGFVAAVLGRCNGAVVAERAAAVSLPADTMREGDVVDVAVLSENLRKLFQRSRLSKRVRVGVANQRTVMRTLELPPVTDAKELAAAVRFQAQDQVPMPLASAVLDFQPLGIVETPGGPRQRVVLVAGQGGGRAGGGAGPPGCRAAWAGRAGRRADVPCRVAHRTSAGRSASFRRAPRRRAGARAGGEPRGACPLG